MSPASARAWLRGAALAVLLAQAQAQAQDHEALPMLPFGEESKWQAIGRVNSAGYNSRRMCSGVLIAPDLVLTAAHCLRRRDGGLIARERLRFVAGVDRGDHAGLARVAAVSLHPGALRAGRVDPRHDLALLTLDAPLAGITPLPVGRVGRAAPGRVALIGYHRGRPLRLSAGFDCPALLGAGLLYVGCPVQPGNSGGPVLMRDGAGWRVVAVVSATGGGVTLAAPVGGWLRAQMAAAAR